MEVFSKINIDLVRKGVNPIVYAVQNDENTRKIVVSLFVDGIKFDIEEGTLAEIGYLRPDGKKGIYDTLPDGSPAFEIEGNVVEVTLVPQVVTIPGKVVVVVALLEKNGGQLGIFPVDVHVSANPGANAIDSEDYINLSKTIGAIVEEKLEEAKESGEFDGNPGKDGTVWHEGTHITGTGTNINMPILGAKTGDFYLNTSTGEVYKSTDGGVFWDHVYTMTGEPGPQGPAGSDANVTTANIAKALGYTPADQTEVTNLSKEIADHEDDTTIHVTPTEKQTWNGKVDKTALTLDKHTDGLIYIFVDGVKVGNGVELGTVVEGDVIGVVDENNNILLSGNLADGTYTFKYENEDGTYTDIGTLEVGAIPEPEPDPEATNFADPTSEDWLTDCRLSFSGSSLTTKPLTGAIVTNFITGIQVNDIVKVEGINFTESNNRQALIKVDGTVIGVDKAESLSGYNSHIGSISYDNNTLQFTVADTTYLKKLRFSGMPTGTAQDVKITITRNGKVL